MRTLEHTRVIVPWQRPEDGASSSQQQDFPMPALARKVEWFSTVSDVVTRWRAACDAVNALYALRLPNDDQKQAFDRDETSVDFDLIGIAARKRFSALEALSTRPDGPEPPLPESLERERQPVNEASDSPAKGVFHENTGSGSETRPVLTQLAARSKHDEREVYGLVGRPGKGGRQQKNWRAEQTRQTRELLDLLGVPFEHRTVAGGVTVLRWLREPSSDSAWFVRLSPTSQEKAQETAMEQLHTMMEQLDEGLLTHPRWIVVTLHNSGGRLPIERYDLMLMHAWITEGWLRRAVFRNEKRLARQKYTLAWCEHILETSGTDLYFTEYRRCINWDDVNDRYLFTFKGTFGAEDRRAIVEQTQKGLDRRYVDEGKGWPNLQTVGLKRDELSGFMVEDEEQTLLLLQGARLFASQNGIKRGVEWLARHMKDEFSFELSPKSWERYLKNEGFVTGDFSFNRKGRGQVPLRHIELSYRMTPRLFQQIREVFATNEGNRRSRPGDFVLLRGGAGQPRVAADERGIFCARCGQKLHAWLQGSHNDTRYRHHGKVPECCRGWGGIERADIEAVVMPELWRLEEVRELREAAVRAAATEDVPVTAHLDTVQRKQLQRDIDDLDREIARLGRAFRQQYLHHGKAARSRMNHFEAYDELVGGLKQDREQLKARIAAADALESVERSIAPARDTGLAQALREILTTEVPEDDAACRRRAAVYGRLVTKLVVDKHDDGRFSVQIHGPLIPNDLPLLNVGPPSSFVKNELKAHLEAEATRMTVLREGFGVDGTTRTAWTSKFEDSRPYLFSRPELQDSSEGTPYDQACNRRSAWLVRVSADLEGVLGV